MLRQSNQIFAVVQAVFFALLISTLGVPAFAQGKGIPHTDHNVSGKVAPGLGSGDAVGTQGSPGTQGPNHSSPVDGEVGIFPEDGLPGNPGGAGDAGGTGGSLTLTVVGDADFSGYTVLGSTGGLAGAGGRGGLGQRGGHGVYSGQFATNQEHMNGATGGVGGTGAAGATGGAGGDLLFTVTNGNVTFAAGTIFGGTGAVGGTGGQGGQGGVGGMGGDAHSGRTTGSGGIGGAGGLGGEGGTGGAGGNVAFTIDNGAIEFNSVTFGGSGGNAGFGGAAGTGGLGGWEGDNSDRRSEPGDVGSQGNAGNGGVGGNGSLTINGGTTTFQGTTYFGGEGGLNADGKEAADGTGTLTMNGGSLNLNGDITFRGADSSFMLGRDARLSSGNATNQIQANEITLDGMVYISNGGLLQLAADNGVYFDGTMDFGLGMDSSSYLDVLGNLTFGENATVSLYAGDDFFASLSKGWTYDLLSVTGDVTGIEFLLANWSASSANNGFSSFRLVWNADDGILSLSAVPEPATLVILGLGLAGLGVARRRRSAA